MNQTQNQEGFVRDFYSESQANSKPNPAKQELGDYVDFEEIKDEKPKK